MTALDDLGAFERDIEDAIAKVVARYQTEIGAAAPDSLRVEIDRVMGWPARYVVVSVCLSMRPQ